jgi:hypothetical protein
MATTLTTSVGIDLVAALSNPLALQTASAPGELHRKYTWPNGTGADSADKLWTDRRTLAPSANESLDLAGTLLDAFGATLTFARIRAIIIAAATANTNNVIVGGAASNGFISWVGTATDTIAVRPGGVFALIARDATAYAVTAATADLLKIANSGAGTSITYEVAIIGASV